MDVKQEAAYRYFFWQVVVTDTYDMLGLKVDCGRGTLKGRGGIPAGSCGCWPIGKIPAGAIGGGGPPKPRKPGGPLLLPLLWNCIASAATSKAPPPLFDGGRGGGGGST